jgi:hypothetical protein
MSVNHNLLLTLLKADLSPDMNVLLDDGEYYIEAQSEDSGLLLRICEMQLLEEDDAECNGGYFRREDGVWILNFCINTGEELLQNVSAELNDKESSIIALWEMRHQTAGYRTGIPWQR